MDEVLFPLVEQLNAIFNERHNTSYVIDDYAHFNLRDVWGLSQEETNDLVHEVIRSDFKVRPPKEGALDALERLTEYCDSYVVTARNEEFEHITRQHVAHFYESRLVDVVLAGNTFYGSSYRPKSQVCQELEADCLIDDGLHNVLECAEQGIFCILFGDYPWNQTDEPLPPNVARAKGWAEVEQILRRRFAAVSR
jgi:uncharacterized HAD superfamily protein